MNFIWSLACPYCGGHTKIDLDQFVTDTSSDEREMGTETEYTVECDAYECPECKKRFGIRGSIWEYPVGAYNTDTIQTVALEEEQEP